MRCRTPFCLVLITSFVSGARAQAVHVEVEDLDSTCNVDAHAIESEVLRIEENVAPSASSTVYKVIVRGTVAGLYRMEDPPRLIHHGTLHCPELALEIAAVIALDRAWTNDGSPPSGVPTAAQPHVQDQPAQDQPAQPQSPVPTRALGETWTRPLHRNSFATGLLIDPLTLPNASAGLFVAGDVPLQDLFLRLEIGSSPVPQSAGYGSGQPRYGPSDSDNPLRAWNLWTVHSSVSIGAVLAKWIPGLRVALGLGTTVFVLDAAEAHETVNPSLDVLLSVGEDITFDERAEWAMRLEMLGILRAVRPVFGSSNEFYDTHVATAQLRVGLAWNP